MKAGKYDQIFASSAQGHRLSDLHRERDPAGDRKLGQRLESPLLTACLLGGAATSIIGMFCRWLSYEIEKRQEERRESQQAR
ncbi:hypothetical protein MPL3365_70419 [Mesorhizobium plurifarium]|uniref:Uncharacterized protein n=1 Tax=Mesorhizobium plurifarium TaxID=69974 RepID=A0A090GCY5_MESPL|nr:hypothetical protein MPL3365_70419 [Mesorhizobium plurifarium]